MSFLQRAANHATLAIVVASLMALMACGPATPANPTQPVPSTVAVAATAAATTVAPLQPTSAPAAPAPTTAPSGQPKTGGRVIVADFADAKTLNPINTTDVPSDVVTTRIYASMLSVDAKTGEVQPGLAESYEFAPDGKTLTFHMRDGVKFSDGSPLTGDDFKFTVMATLRSKKTNKKNTVDQIVGAKEFAAGTATDVSGIAVDGNTVTVSLVNSFCPALTQIGGTSVIPKSVFGKYLDPADPTKNADDAPENNAPPVASGAFMFKEWLPNDHITLVRNDNYWQKANIDEWVYKVYPSQDA
jgi:ABC-type transport system substrate-binding protein